MDAPLHYETLDPENWDAMRALAHRMVDDALDHVRTGRDRPVWQPIPTDVADAFTVFVSGARLYAHNAPFDRRMLDAELARIERPGLEGHVAGIVCTLALANRGLAHLPKKKLDDLCDNFAVDRSARSLHGAT